MPLTFFDLLEHNPWWTEPETIDKDFHIQTFESSSIHWKPRIWRYINLDASDYVLYTIRGPRQVGKTTSLKLTVRDLLKNGVPPQSVFFWPCDEIRDSKTLTKLIDLYLSHPFEQDKTRKYIFLDEVTSVRDWQTSIKYLFDSGKFKNVSLVLNGSHALDMKKGSGQLTGRTGKGNPDCHKMFVPMKFAEFVECTSPDLWKVIAKANLDQGSERRKILLELMYGRDKNINLTLPMIKNDLDQLLDRFLICGGIPRSVDEYVRTGSVSRETLETYVQALRGDLGHWKKDNIVAKLLLSSLVKRVSSEASWNEIAKEVGTTQPTVTEYVETLEQCFAITYLYHTSNAKAPRADTKKNKKIYFEDPFIFHSLRYWIAPEVGVQPLDQITSFLKDESKRGLLMENVVANHLIRLKFNLSPHSEFSYNQDLFYYNPKGKNEVDFIFNHQGRCVPIEVKYRSTINSRHLDPALKVAAENGTRAILVTKDDMAIEDKYAKIPASLLLFLV